MWYTVKVNLNYLMYTSTKVRNVFASFLFFCLSSVCRITEKVVAEAPFQSVIGGLTRRLCDTNEECKAEVWGLSSWELWWARAANTTLLRSLWSAVSSPSEAWGEALLKCGFCAFFTVGWPFSAFIVVLKNFISQSIDPPAPPKWRPWVMDEL